MKARFGDVDTQQKAKDALNKALNPDPSDPSYIVALNLLSQSPRWLTALHALPMYLGLDLRGFNASNDPNGNIYMGLTYTIIVAVMLFRPQGLIPSAQRKAELEFEHDDEVDAAELEQEVTKFRSFLENVTPDEFASEDE